MNVVIFGSGLRGPRQLNLSGLTIGLLGIAVVAVIGTLSFAGGYLYSSSTGSGVSQNEFAVLGDELKSQQDHMGGPEEPIAAGSNVAIPDVVDAMTSLDVQLADREAQLWVLENVLMNENLEDRVYPQGRPVNAGWLSSYFGKRTDPFTGKPANHLGIDFAGKMGADITAVADGVVTWSGDRYGFGAMVEINHGNGYSTRYAHNSENLVEVGDEVRKGQVIALMGKSGRATGPNLHFEVLRNGQRVNPLNFIRDASN